MVQLAVTPPRCTRSHWCVVARGTHLNRCDCNETPATYGAAPRPVPIGTMLAPGLHRIDHGSERQTEGGEDGQDGEQERDVRNGARPELGEDPKERGGGSADAHRPHGSHCDLPRRASPNHTHRACGPKLVESGEPTTRAVRRRTES